MLLKLIIAWLALPLGQASAAQISLRSSVQAVPSVISPPLSALGSAAISPSLLASPALTAPTLNPLQLLQAAPAVQAAPMAAAAPVAVSPVFGPEAGPRLAAPGPAGSFTPFLNGFAQSLNHTSSQDAAKLGTLFDGEKKTDEAPARKASALRESRPDYQPHETVPTAILPSGRAIPPDSFVGGYHGTDIAPEQVQQNGGLPARGPVEDWRLKEHAEEASRPVSAFRGSTPYPTSPDGSTGASYWADEGGWVYQVSDVPTWGVDSELEGRVKRGDGLYRGSLMSEAEGAFPAQTPLECIQRWGKVSESASGKLYVRPGDWVANPRYDPAICRKFWGRPA